MSKKINIVVVLLSIQLLLFGQQTPSSSYQNDTAYVNKYINKSVSILDMYPDSVLLYMDTIISISSNIDYSYGLYKAYNFKGIINWMNNDIPKSIDNYQLALIHAGKLKEKRPQALLYGNIGLAYKQSFMYDSSLLYQNKTIEYSDKHGILDMKAKALFDLSNLYMSKDNYAMTVKYLFKAQEVSNSIQDHKLSFYIHISLGILYIKVKQFDKALYQLRKAEGIDEARDDINQLAVIYNSLGELYFSTNHDYDSAVYYYRKSIEKAPPYQKMNAILSSEINIGNVFVETNQIDSAGLYYKNAYENPMLKNYPGKEAAVLVNLGIYYLEIGDTVNARRFLLEGYILSDELGILQYKKNAVEWLCILDSITGDMDQYLAHYKTFKTLSDTLNATKIHHQIAVLEFEKEESIQKANNELLLKQNQLKNKQIATQKKLIWISLSGLLILLILLYTHYLSRLRRKKLLNQLSEKHHDLVQVNKKLKLTNETLKDQQQQLKELNITKDKFFSILGHDLKSPFNGLIGMLDLLDKQWDTIGDKAKHEYTHSLLLSSKRTHQLLEELLNWGKAQQGLIKYNPETFNLKTKIEHIVDYYTPQIIEKNLTVNTLISADMEMTTDPNLFAQIVQNLVNNAIKFTHSGGEITVETKTNAAGEFCLCVTDSGIGIPEKQLATIFNLNSDFNRPGTNNENSTGMGLILIHEYAEIINGTLTVSSIENKGSTFCLCLKKNNI